MFPTLKRALLPAALFFLLLGLGAALQALHTTTARAVTGVNLDDGPVWFLDKYGLPASNDCADGTLRPDGEKIVAITGLNTFTPVDSITTTDFNDIVEFDSGATILMCVQPATGAFVGPVTFDTDGPGEWSHPACGDDGPPVAVLENDDGDGNGAESGLAALGGGDFCLGNTGEDSNNLVVFDTTPLAQDNDIEVIIIAFKCVTPGVQHVTIAQHDLDQNIEFTVQCKGGPNTIKLTATPDKIESVPALYNSSHSLIRAVVLDASGGPVTPGTVVDFTVSRCGISSDGVDTLDKRNAAVDLYDEFVKGLGLNFLALNTFSELFPAGGLTASTPVIEVDTNDDVLPDQSEALAIFYAAGCAPGPVTVTATIDEAGLDIEATVTITVVGPPAFITITAAPTTLICGEKSEITVTSTDALNQLVSDHTFIEVVTNWGGVLGGTGSSLTYGGPVDPISNTTIELLKGTGKAFLLTSDTHIGQYEVLAASTLSLFGDSVNSKPPVAAQVTVTCTKPAATTITAPNTGTGTIRPPNTGDAGLAAPTSRGNATLYVIFCAVAIVLASMLSFGYARR